MKNIKRKIARNLKKTWKNKLLALLIMADVIIYTIVLKDGTALIFFSLPSITLFFTKDNLVML